MSSGKKCQNIGEREDIIEDIIKPRVVLTTSRRKSNLTNTFMKSLARIIGAPIIRRGSSNLDEIAYNVLTQGFDGFIVIYTNKGNPSVLNFYRVNPNGFFELFGRLFILGIWINTRYKMSFEGFRICYHGNENSSKNVYIFLRDFFNVWRIRTRKDMMICDFIVKDLEVFRDSWLTNKHKLGPAELVFHANDVDLLRIKVHHVWRASINKEQK